MKKLIIIIASLLVAVSAFGQNAKELYNKYSDLKGVSAVYVSPAMFRMIGKLPDMDMEAENGEKVNLTPIVKNLSGFYLLDIEDTTVADKLYAEVRHMIDGKKYELLFEAKDNGEVTRLFTNGNGKTVSSIILTTKDGDEFTFMSLEGNMDREQLENILAESAK
ncbi:MAG: DUF4252 domain-containing protein [Bacteroidales bacterium]|nr:DUF4252 domain-containing protein [Bacteroidales bacterium]